MEYGMIVALEERYDGYFAGRYFAPPVGCDYSLDGVVVGLVAVVSR